MLRRLATYLFSFVLLNFHTETTFTLHRRDLHGLAFDSRYAPLDKQTIGELWHLQVVDYAKSLSTTDDALRRCIENVQLHLPFKLDFPLQSVYQFTQADLSIGKLFEDMDAVAVVAAYAHSKLSLESTNFVTASVKDLRIPLNLTLTNNYVIVGAAKWQTRSTVWIQISLLDGASQQLAEGYFCMAAVDAKTGKAVSIPVEFHSQEQPVRFQFGLKESEHDRLEEHEFNVTDSMHLNIYGKVFGGYLMHELYHFCLGSLLPANKSVEMRFCMNFKKSAIDMDKVEINQPTLFHTKPSANRR